MAEMFKVNAPVRKPLFEGVQGENEARSIVFDITPWVEELGDGAVTATAKRSQDSQPYPVTVTKDGNTVTWKPTSTDTAFAGVGSFQLEYTVDDVLAKTCIWSTMVAPSLDPAGDPPDPYDNWLAEMREISADAIQAAQDADESADDAQAEVYEAEAWAKGTKNGTPVSSSDAQYQNNSKYYSEESYKNAEAWAVGQRGGVDVPSTDPTYENNAKYWAEQSLANQYGAFIVKSASGDIASFADGADNVPMKSLKVAIVPKQAGSGDPSPSNVRPISGTSTANVFVTGTNAWDEEWELGVLNADGSVSGSSSRIVSKNFIPVKGGETYVMVMPSTGANGRGAFYASDKSLVSYSSDFPNFGILPDGRKYGVFTVPENACYLKFNAVANYGTTYNNDISINYPSTDHEYHPYTGHTTPIPLGQTVYGGELDVATGVMTITHVLDLYDGSEDWFLAGSIAYTYGQSKNGKSGTGQDGWCNIAKTVRILHGDYGVMFGNENDAIYFTNATTTWGVTSVAEIKTFIASHNAQIVYPIRDPITVQLTPAQVASLLGTNNVWSDAGSVAVEYRADPTLAYNELANVIVSLGGNL